MAEPQLQSTLTCPHCGYQAAEMMPANACVAVCDCEGCGATLRPLRGSCCVFCAYGSVPCPPVQAGVEPCCTPISEQDSKDWLGNTLTSSVTASFYACLVLAALILLATRSFGGRPSKSGELSRCPARIAKAPHGTSSAELLP